MVTKESKKLQFFSIFSSQIQFYYVYISRTCRADRNFSGKTWSFAREMS